MNCQYCKQPLEEISTFKGGEIFKSECQDCHALFRFFQGASPYLIIWENIFIEEKEYRIKILPDAPHFVVQYWKEHTDRSVTSHYFFSIMELKFLPNWTPQTAAHKLKAYLPFL